MGQTSVERTQPCGAAAISMAVCGAYKMAVQFDVRL